MDYPKTSAEWWEWVDKYWGDLLYILCKYIATHQQATDTEYIDGKLLDRIIIEDILLCKKNKDKKLATYFDAAWAMAPDSPCIHDNPSWGRFCDICSESPVLHEEPRK